MKNIILDLCGGTGAWSNPYWENGYIRYPITLPQYDLLKFKLFPWGLEFPNSLNSDLDILVRWDEIYGVLAAPPCTMFSLARTRAKKPRDFEEGMLLVETCMLIIWEIRKNTKLAFWALENPMGYLRQFLGKPPFTYDPWEFGDPYTKKTDIWGYYNLPKKKYTDMKQVMSEKDIKLCSTNSRRLPSISEITGSKQADRRAITPRGFAVAFYKANSKIGVSTSDKVVKPTLQKLK